jgi:hypothetical protein
MFILSDKEERQLTAYLSKIRQESSKEVQVRHKVTNLSLKALLILRKARRRNEEALL